MENLSVILCEGFKNKTSKYTFTLFTYYLYTYYVHKVIELKFSKWYNYAYGELLKIIFEYSFLFLHKLDTISFWKLICTLLLYTPFHTWKIIYLLEFHSSDLCLYKLMMCNRYVYSLLLSCVFFYSNVWCNQWNFILTDGTIFYRGANLWESH